MMNELAKKHLQPDGTFNTQGFVNELYQYDPKEALDYQEKMNLAKERKDAAQFARQQANNPYHTFIPTANGIYSADARTGDVHLALDANGKPILKDSSDATLQGQIATNKGYGAEKGKTAAENEAAAPAELAVSDQIISNIDKIANNKNLGAATGLSGVLRPDAYIPGTDLYDLKNKNDQLVSETFMQARQMLKGGGAITDFEGKKAEAAVARLNLAQSEGEYRAALKDFRDAVTDGRAKILARQNQGAQLTGNSAANNQPPRTFKVLR